jgi:hypothetical protein
MVLNTVSVKNTSLNFDVYCCLAHCWTANTSIRLSRVIEYKSWKTEIVYRKRSLHPLQYKNPIRHPTAGYVKFKVGENDPAEYFHRLCYERSRIPFR